VWRTLSLDVCDYIISNKRLHCTSEDISLIVFLLLCSWKCNSSCNYCKYSSVADSRVCTVFENKCAVLVCSWTCSSSFCVITVSRVQLQIVQFVQYLYSKCTVFLCCWTWSSSCCVITVRAVQLPNVQFVQFLYSKCAVLLCCWTCSSSCCLITVSAIRLHIVHYLYTQ